MTLYRRSRPDVCLLPRHTDSFRGNTVASRGVRLGAAPDAPLRGRCSSETHFPAGRVVEPWGWFSAHIAEHRAVPVAIRDPVQRSEQSQPEEPDRANLLDHLAALGFPCRACDRSCTSGGGPGRAPYERTASTSRAPQHATGHFGPGSTASLGLPDAWATGARFPGRTLCERYHRTPRWPGRRTCR